MNKAIIKIILPVISFIIVSLSCKKEKDDPKTKLLTQAEWKISKHEEKINSDPYIDYFPSLPSCSQDDKYHFKTDNTYELNEGATKCNSSDPDIISTGGWQFTQNGAKISIDGNESTIDQLNENTFIISGNYYTNPDTNYYRFTFVH